MDGDHSHEGAIQDLLDVLPILKDGTVGAGRINAARAQISPTRCHALPRAATRCRALPQAPSAVASRPRPLTLRLRDFHPSCDDIFRTTLQSLVVLDDTNCEAAHCVDKVSIQKNPPPKLRRLSVLAARTDCTANLRFWSRPRRGTRWWTKASTRSC